MKEKWVQWVHAEALDDTATLWSRTKQQSLTHTDTALALQDCQAAKEGLKN